LTREAGSVRIKSSKLKEEADKLQGKEDTLKQSHKETKECKTVCAWCKRLRRENGEWVEDEEDGRRISHGICPECVSKLRGTALKHPQK
jgi:hypothetical protein